MIQTRSTTRAQAAKLVNPSVRVTRQDASSFAKNSNKAFCPPKARKSKNSSRIEDGCRKFGHFNSNKDLQKVTKEYKFEVPKCLQQPNSSVLETESGSYFGGN